MPKYAAHQNETLDQMVWRILGKGAPVVEMVLQLNPQIANQLFLNDGQLIDFPDAATLPAPRAKIINLWD